MAEIWW